MEEDIERFETLLKTYNVSKSLLYGDKINKETSQSLKSEDVINNISRQIKALANNDTHSKIDNNKIKAFKEYKLTSISNIMLSLEPQKKHLVASTSENNCGYDTQLLFTTKDAEAVTDLGIGVTQEFENSFRLRSQSKVESNIDGESISPDVLKIDVPPQLQLIQETIPYNREHLVNEENKKDNSIDVCNMQNFVSDCKAISSSPLLLSKKTKCEHNTSFLLESFEKFEAIAAPIVHDNYSDVEAMKKIINFKMLHDNKPQVTSEQRQYDDVRYDSESIHLSPILKLKTDQEEIKRHTNFDLPNNDEFIEEDILFSSNETDNDHNQVEELPLTCALQTSFYEQEHVLDKTIYVGFQTASNKSIQVLTDSFTRAKSILNDSYDTKKPINSLSLSELVEAYDSELNERRIKQDPKKAESTEDCKIGNNAFNNMIYSPDKENKLCGIRPRDENVLFKTNTIDAYTQEQIKIDDYMMQEFEENLCIHDNKLHTNLGVSNQQIIFNNEVQLKSNENTNAHSYHCRVQTSTSDKEQNELGKEEKQIKNLDMDDKKLYSNEYQTDKTNSNGIGINQLFTGFKTASNKCIDISKEALGKSRKILDEFHFQSSHTVDERDIKIYDSKNVRNNHFQGFTTASNKSINISDEAYAKSEKIYQDIEFPFVLIDKNQNPNKNKTIDKTHSKKQLFEVGKNDVDIKLGFKTASNIPINISKEALMKSRNFLQEFNCDNDILINNDNETGLKMETLKLVTQRSYGFESTTCESNVMKGRMSKCSKTLHDLDCKKEFCQGFQTASNNAINISGKGFKQSRKKLEEFCLIKHDADNYKENVGDEYDKKIRSIESLKHFSSIAENNPLKNTNTKRMLDLDVDQEIENNYRNKESSYSNAGFTTESNKRAKILKETLIKSKNIVENKIRDQDFKFKESFKIPINKFSGLTNSTYVFQGLKTATSNPVKISDEALEQSKKIFQDIDDCNNCDVDQFKHQKKEFSGLASANNAFQGFKTASNNPVKISDEALEQSKKIFQDIDDCNNCDVDQFKHQKKEFSGLAITNNAFQGFKTASNNTVKISDEALEQSKKIFQDIDNCNNCDVDQFKHQKKEFIALTSTNNAFQGFKTASNNPVKISDEALEKSKKIFQDITTKDCDNHLPENQVVQNTAFNEIGFQTANNKLVNFSEEDLKKSKIIFEDIDSNLKSMIKRKINYDIAFMQNAPVKTRTSGLQCERNILEARKTVVNKDKTPIKNVDISDMINTEVIQNFNDTMLTEDFLNKSPCNKRSGSPILSCPKAKKMKTKFADQPKFEADCEPTEKINRFIFSSNYKKYKKYKLLDVYEMEKVTNAIQSCKEVNYNIDNISSLEFFGARNEISYSKWTTVNIKKCFLELVNKNIIPDGWIENHIKLITLKLLSYEKRFANTMQNVCSVCNVMEQLKYRYERELYNVERPAIRKILEKDEVPSRRMVLQVFNIYKDGVSVTETLDSAENVELLLSDGWYCVKATLDKMLIKLVCEGKITTGTKLVIHGAELLNCEQGVAPWEDTSSVRLKIFGNSTRRAHWAAKLGFHGNGAILSYLTAVRPEGGKISQLRVIVTRVYPMLYVEKFEDGSTVTRSERLENLYQMKYEMERETMLEKIYEEVEKEFCMQASQCDSVDDDRKSLESGSQIYQLLKKSRDPAEFKDSLTHSQAKILQDYVDKRREISLQDLQSKLQSVLKKRGLNVTRNVVAMLKIRVADVYKQNVTKAMITVWRPHESLLHLLGKEGTWLDIHNVVPTAVRYSEIQISAGKQSLFRKTSKVNDTMLNIARTFQRKCYSIQELTQNPYKTTDYNEVDSVGFVFDIEPSVKEFDCKKQLFQNVFLADASKKIICINFWGGLKKFGFENILETEQVVACVNLQKRSGNTRKNIPQYRATEFTYFTKTPKIDVCRKLCEDLSKQFLSLDRRKFIQDCIILRNNLVSMRYGNIENISPYRFNNSDYNLSRNKIFINSPNGDPNLNINGLDFDSTFQQSDTVLPPKALLRKKEISERIAKLQKYGEPPPLSSIHIVNKSKNAVKPYRSPLISKTEFHSLSKNDELSSVKPQTDDSSALDNSDDEKCNNNKCTSPVLPYKRRTVNPVKLNFSKQNVSKDDPFGEDFETSPPLSLD